MSDRVAIRRLATGVPGLDAVLGGGLPEYSLNLIAGPPGSGKTTLAHQLMFSLATREHPALFFTAVGEPPLKMLRYQQQFDFFELARVNDSVRFVSLAAEVTSGHLSEVLSLLAEEVRRHAPGFVFIDSLRSLRLGNEGTPEALTVQQLDQELSLLLGSWQATTFLIGEDIDADAPQPILTIADGLIFLEQSVHRNSIVRKLEIPKMRGQSTSPGKHTFRITGAGIEVFPLLASAREDDRAEPIERPSPGDRVNMGIPQLDEMLGGGLPVGNSLLVAGPSGSGKTILATAFLAEGFRRGEKGVLVAFEQNPRQSLDRTLDDLVRSGAVGLINTRALDLSIDEIVQQLLRLIRVLGARRVVIDSLSGFELAVAPCFREDFRESLFRLVAGLADVGVTVVMTSELEDRYTDLRFSPAGSAFLTDAIVVQRYVEIDGRLKRVLAVVKVRGSPHSAELREYEISDEGLTIGARVSEYEGLLGGRPTLARGSLPPSR